MSEVTTERTVGLLSVAGGLAVFALGIVMSNGIMFGEIGGAIAAVTGNDVAAGSAIGGAIGGAIWVGGATAAGAAGGPGTAAAGFVAGVKSSGGAVALGGA